MQPCYFFNLFFNVHLLSPFFDNSDQNRRVNPANEIKTFVKETVSF